MELSKRVKTLTPSSTLAITAKANELKKAGHNVIGLGAGEPDMNTPDYILEGAVKAMKKGFTKYTQSGGIPELKKAISNKFQRDNALTYSSDQIIVTSGAKHALYTLFQVILDEGDEVMIPGPYWVSYPEQVKLAGGVPLFLPTTEKSQFKVTAEQIEKAITNKTKAIVINSPSNPTGMVYSKQELKEIGEVCLKHDLLIVSDEIYEKLIYTDEPHVSIASLSNELYEQTIVINGVSKSHAMTGWRIGYAAGSEKIIKAMTSLASHSTSNPTSIAQYAALAAYETDANTEEVMRQTFSKRLDRFYELITDIKGITCIKPKGAFYIFPNVKKAAEINGFRTVEEWAAAILEEEKVALVPGSGFGAPDNVRLSYALALDDLEEAAKRIKRFVESHQK